MLFTATSFFYLWVSQRDRKNDVMAAIRKRCNMTTRILVINNSDDILALFRKILEEENAEVYLQLFLNSDLREVRRIQPELIILDYYVGREGVGWEFLQLLRMEDTTAAIPVLICTTAVSLVQEIAAYLATKRVSVLRKPFDSRDLVNAVRSVLQLGVDVVSTPPANLPASDGSVKMKDG
jgi:DNA-binding response OmpR family regulator